MMRFLAATLAFFCSFSALGAESCKKHPVDQVVIVETRIDCDLQRSLPQSRDVIEQTAFAMIAAVGRPNLRAISSKDPGVKAALNVAYNGIVQFFATFDPTRRHVVLAFAGRTTTGGIGQPAHHVCPIGDDIGDAAQCLRQAVCKTFSRYVLFLSGGFLPLPNPDVAFPCEEGDVR